MQAIASNTFATSIFTSTLTSNLFIGVSPLKGSERSKPLAEWLIYRGVRTTSG